MMAAKLIFVSPRPNCHTELQVSIQNKTSGKDENWGVEGEKVRSDGNVEVIVAFPEGANAEGGVEGLISGHLDEHVDGEDADNWVEIPGIATAFRDKDDLMIKLFVESLERNAIRFSVLAYRDDFMEVEIRGEAEPRCLARNVGCERGQVYVSEDGQDSVIKVSGDTVHTVLENLWENDAFHPEPGLVKPKRNRAIAR